MEQLCSLISLMAVIPTVYNHNTVVYTSGSQLGGLDHPRGGMINLRRLQWSMRLLKKKTCVQDFSKLFSNLWIFIDNSNETIWEGNSALCSYYSQLMDMHYNLQQGEAGRHRCCQIFLSCEHCLATLPQCCKCTESQTHKLQYTWAWVHVSSNWKATDLIQRGVLVK